MLTQDELDALIQLLVRAPMTQAEALWAQALINRLRREAALPGDDNMPGGRDASDGYQQ